MDEKRIRMVAEEAARLNKDNPDWTYKKAMERAKGMILGEKWGNDSKVNRK